MKDLILSIYYSTPNLQHLTILGKIANRLWQKLFKNIADVVFSARFNSSRETREKNLSFREKELITSLTSFPARIGKVHLSIECILDQSIKPDRVILWLASEQFPDGKESLPMTLLRLESKGLEIEFCEDLRSHKKYYYALKKHPNANVIMFDDDLYYHKDIIKNLLELNQKNPTCIAATRVHRLLIDKNSLKPYRSWFHNYNGGDPSHYNMHTSGAGTLIPPNLPLDSTFFDIKLIRTLSPHSDDVWWKVNLIRLGIKVVTNGRFNKDPLTIGDAFKNSLVSQNTFEGKKDIQLKETFDYLEIKIPDDLDT
ncbi:MAG: hypothetical protein ACRBG0_04380 [Lewinella sp.]|uniref:hypothetical protein n=1 Tax=Lewinella sp. TaxID=2004506 RepID=UPI003D6ADE57